MAMDIISSMSDSAAQTLSQVSEDLLETVAAANNVLVMKDSFRELAHYMERIEPIMKELRTKCAGDSEILRNSIEILNREVKSAKQLALECCKRNKVYLLMNCRGIVKRLQDATREMSKALILLQMTSLDFSSTTLKEIGKLCDSMKMAEFKAGVAEEEIMAKIESGIQERNVDSLYANNLLVLIAQAVGTPTEKSALRKEFEDFKSEVENSRLKRDQAEAIQMDQIIALLEKADAALSLKEKELRYFSKRESLGGQPQEPLQSFYCPITRDVMEDPVEISSGQTFERSAIEKWFADGNNLCPLTLTPLDTSILRPNKTLRQSIQEWKDRNTMITIASLKPKLISGDDEQVLDCLAQLNNFCEQRELHQEWIILENYIPILLQLLDSKNRDVRYHVLVILLILAFSDDAKERIAKVDNAIELIGRSLGRRPEERRFAVALLLELSKYNQLRDFIGRIQGCILLLATISSGDDCQASRDAEELLKNLSFSDQNIVQMAKANYFRHLLQRLSSGPDDAKIVMATTLAEMELTDHSKVLLLEGGVLGPLLHLVSYGDVQMKKVAVRTLHNLSSMPKIGMQMIREGAAGPLLDLLLRHSASSSSLQEQVAATIMHLAVSTLTLESSEAAVPFLVSDEEILMLFSLINLTGPDVQKNILQVFQALCQSPSGTSIKAKLLQCSAIQLLVQLCEHDSPLVRANAVKLYCCLASDVDQETILEHVNKKFVETLIRIIQTSNDEEQRACAVGITSELPELTEITQWLIDAGAIPVISGFIRKGKYYDSQKSRLIENAVAAIHRFTLPENLMWQKQVAEAGIIPILVQFLDFGTSLTKKHASDCLSRLSKNSSGLSQPIPKRKAFICFSAAPEQGCAVHGGICSVESSFCLIEADAVRPLVMVLRDSDPDVCEAALDAMLTLIEDEQLMSGSKVLAEAKAIQAMINFLSSPSSSLQEKALRAIERIFRLPEYKQKFGPAAQMQLVDLTQRGSGSMKSLAARVLAHLNVLQDQSSYF